jgi:prepilin-type N-terminal cleavage/methylation domain-containing protein
VKLRSLPDGFTLVELMLASSISTVIMAGLLTGSIALQRGYAAARYQVECQEDELRVMDCITRDLRRAQSVTLSNGNRRLSLTVQDQVDPVAGTLRTPKIVDGEVQYNTSSTTIAYYVSGTAFIRREGGVETVMSTNPSGLENFFVYHDHPELSPPRLRVTISFAPKFSRTGGAAPGAATRCSSVVRLRNAAHVVVQ